MRHKTTRTLLLILALVILVISDVQLSGGRSHVEKVLLSVWATVLLIGAVGTFLSMRRDTHDLLAFVTLIVIALLFIGSYSANLHMKKESTEAINTALSLSNGFAPCKGSDLWLEMYIS